MIDRAIDEFNVLFIVADCCRYDTAAEANIPNIRGLGELRRALTFGTYTLPAHASFYAGYIPNVVEPPLEDYYSRQRRQLWRLTGARHREHATVGLMLEGRDIFEGYRRLGFYTLGAGGVRWFRNPALTSVFDHFFFWGNDDRTDVFADREPANFPLEHMEEILQQLSGREKWFLFVNTPETHAPYDGAGPLPAAARSLLDKAKPRWGGKYSLLPECEIAATELASLRQYQVRSLEEIDRRLGRMIRALLSLPPARPLLVVFCADHGESFGENMMFGHGFPAEEVMNVPLVIGTVA